MEAGKIRATIELDREKFRMALKAAQKELRGFAKKAKPAFAAVRRAAGRLAKKLKFALVAAIAATTYAVIKMGKSFVNAASNVEDAEVRLRSLRGSSEKAAKAMEFMRKVAGKVPFTFQKVVDSGVTLDAMGASMETWLPVLSDLAAVMGIDLPIAASALGRAYAGGAGAADIFRERGILNIIKDTSKLKYGIDDLSALTLPQFRDMMHEAFTDPQGKIAGASKRLAKTWRGQLSMLQDAIFDLQAAAGQVLLPTLKEIVTLDLKPMVENWAKWVKANKELLAIRINEWIDSIREADTLWRKILAASVIPMTVPGYIQTARQEIKKLQEELTLWMAKKQSAQLQLEEEGFEFRKKRVRKRLEEIREEIKAREDRIKVIVEFIEKEQQKSREAAEALIQAERDKQDVMGDTTDKIEEQKTAWQKFFDGIKSETFTLQDFWKGMTARLQSVWSEALWNMSEKTGTFKDFFKSTFEIIKRYFIEDFVKTILRGFGAMFGAEGKEGQGTIFGKIFGSIFGKGKVGESSEETAKDVNKLGASSIQTGAQLSGLAKGSKKAFGALFKGFGGLLDFMGTGFGQFFSALMAMIGSSRGKGGIIGTVLGAVMGAFMPAAFAWSNVLTGAGLGGMAGGLLGLQGGGLITKSGLAKVDVGEIFSGVPVPQTISGLSAKATPLETTSAPSAVTVHVALEGIFDGDRLTWERIVRKNIMPRIEQEMERTRAGMLSPFVRR